MIPIFYLKVGPKEEKTFFFNFFPPPFGFFVVASCSTLPGKNKSKIRNQNWFEPRILICPKKEIVFDFDYLIILIRPMIFLSNVIINIKQNAKGEDCCK